MVTAWSQHCPPAGGTARRRTHRPTLALGPVRSTATLWCPACLQSAAFGDPVWYEKIDCRASDPGWYKKFDCKADTPSRRKSTVRFADNDNDNDNDNGGGGGGTSRAGAGLPRSPQNDDAGYLVPNQLSRRSSARGGDGGGGGGRTGRGRDDDGSMHDSSAADGWAQATGILDMKAAQRRAAESIQLKVLLLTTFFFLLGVAAGLYCNNFE